MALTGLGDFVNRMTGGNSGTPEHKPWMKVARIAGAAAPATIAGRMHSLWTYDGSPSAGVAPTTVAVPTRATAGALKQANPGGGRTKLLTGWGASPEVGGALLLYDRLLHIGSLSGTVTTAQTVAGSLNRYTSATESIGNMILVEIYSAIGATATTITASYSNEGGTSGRTTTAIAFGGTNNREQTRCFLLPLQSGDEGVTAVASVTVLATTGTAGNFGVTLYRQIAVFRLDGCHGWDADPALDLGMIPEIPTDACLFWILSMPAFYSSTGGTMIEFGLDER